jgi:non-specific serine/threonine protein kinase/serine/threonine-protein kinase
MQEASSDETRTENASRVDGRLRTKLASLVENDAPPDTIPGYRLLRPIGSGGMGHVWEAEQREPVRRKVAVKIIRPGADTARIVTRFESERQTLALMNHPGIAQVYDAGVTDSGRPFFSMELVEGSPVTQFCDEAHMTVTERLRLFGEVFEAVQHAHQKGVIHRDLKPSNVLVTRFGGRPTPKVIDFGIARFVEESHPERTLLTEAGTVVGTPEYMSPEQAGVESIDIDTRSDVYSLGVLLYELLTGSLPFTRSDSTPAALVELFRHVREAELPLPSRYVAGLGEQAHGAAITRGTDRWALTKSLRGELDWITAKALEKDRERRYPSVGELAADVRRYLRDEPVVAGPPGAAYRLRKLVRRHRGLLAASAAVVVALVAGLAGTLTGLVRAREEAERARTQVAIAEAVNAFLNEDLLAAVAPEGQGREVSMREVLDTAAERLEGRFADQPEVEASVRETIGSTYTSLGLLDEASPQVERAVTLREAVLGKDHASTLDTVHELGVLRFYQGKGEEAEALLRRAFEGRSRVLGPNDPLTLTALSDLGAVAHHLGRLDEAEHHYRDAHDRAIAELGEDDPYVLTMLHNLGALLRDLGRFEESESFLRRALEGTRKELGEEHPETLSTLSLLGSVMREDGRLEEAEPIYVRVLETRRRVLGDDHPSTLMSTNNLAMLRSDLGQLEEAAELQRRTLETQRRVLGDDHDGTILSLGNLAAVLIALDRANEAEPLIAEALERCQRTLGADHSLCGSTLRKQGRCLTALGRYDEAERALLDAHANLVAAYDADHPEVALVATSLVHLYDAWDRSSEAAAWKELSE